MVDEKPGNHVVCACGKCRHTQHNAYIEINFFDQKIYWLCPECREMNTLDFPTFAQKPFPKSSTMLGRKRRS